MHYDEIDQHVERWYSEPHDPAPAQDDEPWVDTGLIWEIIIGLAILAGLLIGILLSRPG